MGLLANLPVGLAPGLGLNAYVSVVLRPHHIGKFPHPSALSSHTPSLVSTEEG